MPPETGPAAPAPQQPVRISADAVQAARVMVDTFRLPSLRKPEDILEGILDGLAALVHPDAAGVYVVDARGQTLRYTLVRGCDYPVARLEAPFEEQGAIGKVLATGRPLQVTADSAPDALEGRPCARSRLLVPILSAGNRVLGVLDAWSDDPDGYSADAAELLATYGLAVAGTIESARLQRAMAHKRRLDGELVLARQVMNGLLPRATPSLPGFDIAGTHETSLEVGGDYYEFIPIDDDRWGVVVADVVGKGIAAALLAAAIRASIASLVGYELAVRAIMRRANRFFHDSVEDGKYVTLFFAFADVLDRRLLYSNAGHLPPILLRAGGGVELLEEGGVPLGLFKAPRYVEGHVALAEGDLLVLYTDGIVETADADDAPYGVDRFVAVLQQSRESSAREICAAVMRDVRRHGSVARQDDRTLVVIKAT